MKKKRRTLKKDDLLASIVTTTGMRKSQVVAILDTLAAEIKAGLGHRDVGAIEISGLLNCVKKVPAPPLHNRVSKANLRTNIAGSTGVSNKQVTAVLESLANEIRKALGKGLSITHTINGLLKKGRTSACPKWLSSVKVAIVSELLPGPGERCERGLHKYYRSPAANNRGYPICSLCGEDTIDWERLHKRDVNDVEYTIGKLKTDRWKCKWWLNEVDPKAARYATKKGPAGTKDAVRQRVVQSVGRVYQLPNGRAQPYNDGGQTTKKVGKMNIIHYGQHATATCCRKCIEVWHGIPQGRALTKKEQAYIVALLMAYITFKLPEIGAD